MLNRKETCSRADSPTADTRTLILGLLIAGRNINVELQRFVLWSRGLARVQLFWRWNLPMFSGEGRGDYGVDPADSTFAIIREHTRRVNQKINSVPPRAGCGYECWVPVKRLGMRACKRDQAACDAYWEAAAAAPPGQAPAGGAFFTSKAHCCRPGLGAYSSGCSWLAF